jgi:hypothetical protein
MAGLCLLLCLSHGTADETPVASLPERIVLNLTDTPFNSQAVTWRAAQKSGSPRAEIIPVPDLLKPGKSPKTFPAVTSVVELEKNTFTYQHSVIFSGLIPGVRYAYRVGDDPAWSEWNQFKTALDKPEPFTFLYFGDVQEQVFSMCSQVFRAAFQKEPDAGFWLFAGDMVNNGSDDPLWAEFFSALGWIPRTMPLIPVAGNHEYPDPRKTPKEDLHITPLWRPQFTLPENGPRGLEETAFSFEYQGACVIVLNGNEQTAEQALWLETVLSKNRQPWIIVAIHQPVYSISERKNRTEFQDLFVPIFDRYSVDLVLQGHDHGYARTLSLKNHQPVSGKEKGTVYIISNSGPKFYPAGNRYDHLMTKTLSNSIWFQSIRVEAHVLKYTAFDMEREIADAFEIKKF